MKDATHSLVHVVDFDCRIEVDGRYEQTNIRVSMSVGWHATQSVYVVAQTLSRAASTIRQQIEYMSQSGVALAEKYIAYLNMVS